MLMNLDYLTMFISDVKSLNETDLDLSGLGNASTLVVNQSDLANGSKDPANASTLAITESPMANKSDPANASTLAVIESPVASKSDPANASTLAVNGNDGDALGNQHQFISVQHNYVFLTSVSSRGHFVAISFTVSPLILLFLTSSPKPYHLLYRGHFSKWPPLWASKYQNA